MVTKIIWAFLFALIANGIAEWILARDLQQPINNLSRPRQTLRLARWVVSSLFICWIASVSSSLLYFIPFALFTTSAATDLETKYLPPDAFTYGSVVIGLAVCFSTGGWVGLRHGLIAQAACFALWTLGVAFFRLCDAGDIKLAMQFGAVCGSLPNVGLALMVVWLAACTVVLIATLLGLRDKPPRQAIQQAATLRPPQGPLLWCGVVALFFLPNLMRGLL